MGSQCVIERTHDSQRCIVFTNIPETSCERDNAQLKEKAAVLPQEKLWRWVSDCDTYVERLSLGYHGVVCQKSNHSQITFNDPDQGHW